LGQIRGGPGGPLEHAFPHAKLNYYLFKTPPFFHPVDFWGSKGAFTLGVIGALV